MSDADAKRVERQVASVFNDAVNAYIMEGLTGNASTKPWHEPPHNGPTLDLKPTRVEVVTDKAGKQSERIGVHKSDS